MYVSKTSNNVFCHAFELSLINLSFLFSSGTPARREEELVNLKIYASAFTKTLKTVFYPCPDMSRDYAISRVLREM